MTRRAAALVSVALAAAVASIGCNKGGVVLTVRAQNVVADQLSITARYGGRTVTRLRPDPASASPLAFPEDLFADLGSEAVDVVFTVDALAHGQVVATASLPSLHVGAGQQRDAALDLVPLQIGAPPPVTPPPPPSYAAVVLADAPLAYYRFDDAPGSTVARDASGNHLDGTYGAEVVRGVPGLLAGDSDGAARFDGGNWSLAGVVTVPRNPLLEPTAALSIEMWLSPIANNPDFAILIDYGDSSTVTHQPPYGTLIFGNAIGTLGFTDVEGNIGSQTLLTVTHPAPQSVYHYVQTYDGVNVRLYVNGVLEAQQPVSGMLSGYGVGGLGIGGAAVDVGDLIFAGTLDEVALYPVALTPQRVQAHYAAGARH